MSTRSRATSAPKQSASAPRVKKSAVTRNSGSGRTQTRSKRRPADNNDEDAPEEFEESEVSGEEYQHAESDSDDVKSLNSDALDDDDEFDDASGRKRKRGSTATSPTKKKAKPTPRKSASTRKKRQPRKDGEEEEELELAEGQEVVGRVVQAPKSGRVPPGRISQNTFDFFAELKKPECNDREWFKLHEPVFRLAEQEWKAFVESFTDILIDIDTQIPPLPPKDVIHRIYRDVRFSNDKTPYKAGFSASFSRSGRKGVFAGYHVAVKPGNESLIAAGTWCPGKNELATIRSHIQRSPVRLRQVLSDNEFVAFFGEPTPHPKGKRRSIFGMDDQLKTAPKGVDKNHKDIDLLKCRSFAVVHRFTDTEVLDPNFKEALGRVVKVMRPFVHCLNDMMTLPPDDANESANAEESGDEEADGNTD